jgi:aryl-alcohol dehydrogenase-like predicted oxidoreductase
MPVSASGTFALDGSTVVHRLGFGAMRITGPGIWGWPEDRAAAIALCRRVVDLGVDLVDTADSYGPETSEYLLADALHPYPDGLVIATKGGLIRNGPTHWGRDGRPAHLETALNNSLRRLRVDTIDLYQLHAPDPNVPFLDSVGFLVRAKEQGKLRHLGLSNVSVAQLDAARALTPIASVQNRYHAGDRSSEAVLRHCEAHGIGFIPWYPLGAGPLLESGPITTVAARLGATPAQVALAWLLAKSPVMLPIPGTGSIAHLDENCGAADVVLGPHDLATLG